MQLRRKTWRIYVKAVCIICLLQSILIACIESQLLMSAQRFLYSWSNAFNK